MNYMITGGKKRKDSYETIQDPGAKSVESLVSKVKRNIENEGIKGFTLGNVSDLARCSILLFDSFKEIPKFLYKLREQIPGIQGDISRNETGYRGIHLNCAIDGVNVEIQLSTKKAWPYKVVAEKYYSKWRDFNQRDEFKKVVEAKKEYEIALTEFKKGNLEKDYFNRIKFTYTELRDKLLQKLKEQSVELEMGKGVFDELFSDGEFERFEMEIEAILLSFSATIVEDVENEKSIANKKILDKQIEMVDTDHVDEGDATKKAEEAHDLATKTQTNLISMVESSLSAVAEKANDENKNAEIIDKNVAIVEYILIEYDKKLAQCTQDTQFIDRNIKKISKQRKRTAIEITRYCVNMKIESLEPEQIVKMFFEDLNNGKLPLKREDFSVKTLLESLTLKEEKEASMYEEI